MQKSLLIRLLVIAGLILILLIPLQMIEGVVSQRQSLQHQVEQTIAASSSGAQRLAGPLLIVPYTEQEIVVSVNDKGKEKKEILTHHRNIIFAPSRLRYDVIAKIEPKYKGIYKALTYRSEGKWTAEFEVPANLGLALDPKLFTVGVAYLAVGVTDVRGLSGTPKMLWNGEPLVIANGTNTDLLGDGVQAVAPLVDVLRTHRYEATINLNVAGLGSLAVAPLAASTVVNLTANWPHPNFGGLFLPQSKTMTDSGFNATWEVSQLASRNISLMQKAASEKLPLETFDVSFIEPANIYQQAERAVKYGVLFIMLTFAAFFLLETLRDIRIHPMQYAMVGLALAVFFLLLVSLSEHIRFLYAYLIASSACMLLISYYLAHVLGSRMRGLWFGLKIAVLYSILFVLLQSEDNALVMGSVLLFIVLGLAMILTRKLNWYQLASHKTTA